MPDVSLAPTPLHLGGVEYMLSPLGDDDIEELNQWLRSRVIQMAQQSLTDDMSPEVRREILSLAIDKARQLSWISGAGAAEMATLEGLSRVVWQGLRRNHPELTHAQVRKLIIDKKTVEYAMAVWRELNLQPAAKQKGRPADGSPKARRQSRRKH